MRSGKRQITAARRAASGPAGLVAAIMAQAYVDALDGRQDAKEYFNGPVYRHHLGLLGLPADWRPNF